MPVQLQLHGTSNASLGYCEQGGTLRFALFLSSEETQTILDPKDAAEAADLRYVSDERPRIRRKKSGKGFIYLRPDGTRVSDPRVLRRIRSLAVPPAWIDVWICPFSDGHIQATGRDARGRKQYRYHPLFRELRESTKFEHVVAFAEALPVITSAPQSSASPSQSRVGNPVAR
jgi:DNA topoisomerase-1